MLKLPPRKDRRLYMPVFYRTSVQCRNQYSELH